MRLEVFLPSIEKIFFLTKALLSTRTQYVYFHQFAVRRVSTVSVFNRQKIMKKCKKVHRLLAKLLHSHHSKCLVQGWFRCLLSI